MKFLSLCLSTAIFALLFLGCESNQSAQTVIEDNGSFKELKSKINTTYTLKTTTGKTIVFDLEKKKIISKELNGKTVLLNFWATWCPPCIEEMPTFNRLYEKYGDKFEIIGVLFEKEKDLKELEAFMVKHNMQFPVTVGPENFRLSENIGNVSKIPESFLYSRSGDFIKKYVGIVDEKELESYIK